MISDLEAFILLCLRAEVFSEEQARRLLAEHKRLLGRSIDSIRRELEEQYAGVLDV